MAGWKICGNFTAEVNQNILIMKRNYLFLFAALCTTLGAWAWGQKGHDVTAYIAEQHLTPEAKAKVIAALDGHSLVYYANWLDNASNTPEYRYTKTWHYKNVDEGETYENAPLAKTGDVVVALGEIMSKLKNGNLSHDDENVALRMLIHLVGDLHQPLHMGHRSDLGGNKVNIMSFNRPTNLHSYWDSELVEFVHKWSYSEWQFQIDRASAEEEAQIVSGDIDAWAKECVAITAGIYADTPEGTKVSYDYGAKYAPVVEQQLLKGGLRLAHLLNSIYR